MPDAKTPNGILDLMAADAGGKKRDTAAKAGLTPVGIEPGGPLARAGIPDVPGVFLTNEALRDVALDLRTQAALLIAVADGLDQLTSLSSVREDKPAVIVPATAERADIPPPTVSFEEAYAAKSAAAQAATFGPAPDRDWRCPQHPSADRKVLTSRKNRQYSACTVVGCQQEERLGR